MKYYRRNNGVIYEERETLIPVTSNCEEISREEYEKAVCELNEKIKNTNIEGAGQYE